MNPTSIHPTNQLHYTKANSTSLKDEAVKKKFHGFKSVIQWFLACLVSWLDERRMALGPPFGTDILLFHLIEESAATCELNALAGDDSLTMKLAIAFINEATFNDLNWVLDLLAERFMGSSNCLGRLSFD